METLKERLLKISEFDMRFYAVYVEPDYSTVRHYDEWEDVEGQRYRLQDSKDFLIEQYGHYLVKEVLSGSDWSTTICIIPPLANED